MSGTVIVRHVIATPARPASEAWAFIASLLAPQQDSNGRRELERIAGIASALIADEALKDAAAVVYGNGPRVRIYCLYDDDAISGDKKNESAVPFAPADGDWRMSLPCSADDFEWVSAALQSRSGRITARKQTDPVNSDEEDSTDDSTANSVVVNKEVFLRS
jgi:hypothetical protein